MNARILGQGFEKAPIRVDMTDAVVKIDPDYGDFMESIVIYSAGDEAVGVRVQFPRGTLAAAALDALSAATEPAS